MMELQQVFLALIIMQNQNSSDHVFIHFDISSELQLKLLTCMSLCITFLPLDWQIGYWSISRGFVILEVLVIVDSR